MKKMTFKQWYAVIVLVVFIIYGWLYLMENRYKRYEHGFFDTWKQELVGPEKFIDLD